MDIIHADADRHEIGFIRDFKKFDAEISQTPKLDRNQFVLTMDEDDYLESGITDEDFVYIPFSEFGGQVDEIKHASRDKLQYLVRRGAACFAERSLNRRRARPI